MRPSSVTTRWIAIACAALVLLAQVLGLHYHRHVEPAGGHAHGTELHFEDGGLHLDEVGANNHHHDGQSHWHVDVESKALKSGVAKAFLDSLLLPLLMVMVLLSIAGSRTTTPRRWVVRECRHAKPFELRPPSQAPPSHFACA